jgi:hypothetical protein
MNNSLYLYYFNCIYYYVANMNPMKNFFTTKTKKIELLIPLRQYKFKSSKDKQLKQKQRHDLLKTECISIRK